MNCHLCFHLTATTWNRKMEWTDDQSNVFAQFNSFHSISFIQFIQFVQSIRHYSFIQIRGQMHWWEITLTIIFTTRPFHSIHSIRSITLIIIHVKYRWRKSGENSPLHPWLYFSNKRPIHSILSFNSFHSTLSFISFNN